MQLGQPVRSTTECAGDSGEDEQLSDFSKDLSLLAKRSKLEVSPIRCSAEHPERSESDPSLPLHEAFNHL